MLEGIQLLPCDYTVNGTAATYWGDVDRFDGHAFYESLRKGSVVKTSLLNTQLFLSRFAPILTQGLDIIYISMSSGISGTYNAATIAAQELTELYSRRFIHIVDSLGCGFGNGLLAIRAAALSRQGVPAREAAAILDAEVPHTCQYFTVDDLNFLKNTGRVSGMTAKIATVLNIKPVLQIQGGKLDTYKKVRGLHAAQNTMLDAIRKDLETRFADMPMLLRTAYTGDASMGKAWNAQVQERFPDFNVTGDPLPISISCHVGPKVIALGLIKKI